MSRSLSYSPTHGASNDVPDDDTDDELDHGFSVEIEDGLKDVFERIARDASGRLGAPELRDFFARLGHYLPELSLLVRAAGRLLALVSAGGSLRFDQFCNFVADAFETSAELDHVVQDLFPSIIQLIDGGHFDVADTRPSRFGGFVATTPLLGRRVRLSSLMFPGRTLGSTKRGIVKLVDPDGSPRDVFHIVPALGGGDRAVSFESAARPGFFLRHDHFLMRNQRYDFGDPLFAADASFRPCWNRFALGHVSFESVNFPDHWLMHFELFLRIDEAQPRSTSFRRAASFNCIDAVLAMPPPDLPEMGQLAW